MFGRVTCFFFVMLSFLAAQGQAIQHFQAQPVLQAGGMTFYRFNNVGMLAGFKTVQQCSPSFCLPAVRTPVLSPDNGQTIIEINFQIGSNQLIHALNDAGMVVGDGFVYMSGNLTPVDISLTAVNSLNIAVGQRTLVNPNGANLVCGAIVNVADSYCISEFFQLHLTGINDASNVTGYIDPFFIGGFRATAFVWNGKTTYYFPPVEVAGTTLDQSFTVAIQKDGEVAGNASSNATGLARAFRWLDGNVTLIDPLPGDTYTNAVQLNDPGTLLGYSGNDATSEQHPIVSFQGNSALPLNDLLVNCAGCLVTYVHDINNNGQILATGKVNGQDTQMVMTPIP